MFYKAVFYKRSILVIINAVVGKLLRQLQSQSLGTVMHNLLNTMGPRQEREYRKEGACLALHVAIPDST